MNNGLTVSKFEGLKMLVLGYGRYINLSMVAGANDKLPLLGEGTALDVAIGLIDLECL